MPKTRTPKQARLGKKLQEQKNTCLNFFKQIPEMPPAVKTWLEKRLESDKALIKICFGKILLYRSGDARQDGLYTGIWDYRLQELSLELHKKDEEAALEEIIFLVRNQDRLTAEERDALTLLMWQADSASVSRMNEAIWLFTNRSLRDVNPLYMGYGYNAVNFKNFKDYQRFLKDNILYQNSRIDKALDAYLRRFHSGQFSELMWELKKQVKSSKKTWEKIVQAETKKIYNLSQLDKIIGSLIDSYWEKHKQKTAGFYWKPNYGQTTQKHFNQDNISELMTMLGLKKEDLSADNIRKQFRKKVLKSHPDLGGNQDTFIALKSARDQLMDLVNNHQNHHISMG